MTILTSFKLEWPLISKPSILIFTHKIAITSGMNNHDFFTTLGEGSPMRTGSTRHLI